MLRVVDAHGRGYLEHQLAALMTPANDQERAQVGVPATQIQAMMSESVEIAFVDQGYTSERPAAAAAEHGIQLEVV